MKAKAPRKSLQVVQPWDSGPPIGPPDDDLAVALDKARAARILLRADADYLQIPISLEPGESEEEIRAWIQTFAFDALDAALEEAKVAHQKEHDASKHGGA